MTGEFSESWLSLREPADAESRAAELVPLIPGPVRVIRDLGCGTGSLGRWLAPKLPTPQHWVMMDRDPALLDYAREHMPFDGVTVETVLGDVTSLTAADLAGTDLVTCSALLDLLTDAEITALAEVCARRCPPSSGKRSTSTSAASWTGGGCWGRTHRMPQLPRSRRSAPPWSPVRAAGT
jgi:2-polyprenyl-3-methyl-5-hydroxy-6-metoxy-1,4-benzoquinol methylase